MKTLHIGRVDAVRGPSHGGGRAIDEANRDRPSAGRMRSHIDALASPLDARAAG